MILKIFRLKQNGNFKPNNFYEIWSEYTILCVQSFAQKYKKLVRSLHMDVLTMLRDHILLCKSPQCTLGSLSINLHK